MADLHPSASNPAAQIPAMAEAVARWPIDDPDLALGCECADPALQIERWAQESSAAGTEPH
jgi:hypothetical protein